MPRPLVSPVALVVIATATVQLGSSFAKDLFGSAPPVAVAWLRLTFTALVLFVALRPRLRGHTWPQWRAVLLYGLVMSLMNFVFYLSIARIPIGMAVTIEFLGPLAVAVIGAKRVRDYLWAVLALAGVALLGFTPGALDPLGVAFAVAAGVCWAGYIVVGPAVGRAWSGVSGVAVAGLVGSALYAVPALLTAFTGSGLGGLVGGAADARPWAGDAHVWLLGLVVALCGSVVPYGLEMVALRTIDRGVFGILMSIEPAMAAFFAFLVLGEALKPIELLAMAFVIIASIGATRSSRAVETAQAASS